MMVMILKDWSAFLKVVMMNKEQSVQVSDTTEAQ